jgi:hypothetical protein
VDSLSKWQQVSAFAVAALGVAFAVYLAANAAIKHKTNAHEHASPIATQVANPRIGSSVAADPMQANTIGNPASKSMSMQSNNELPVRTAGQLRSLAINRTPATINTRAMTDERVLRAILSAAKNGNAEAARSIALQLRAVAVQSTTDGSSETWDWMPAGESQDALIWLEIAAKTGDPDAILDLLDELSQRKRLFPEPQRQHAALRFDQALEDALRRRLAQAVSIAVVAWERHPGYAGNPMRALGYRLAQDALANLTSMSAESERAWSAATAGDRAAAISLAEQTLGHFR